MSRNSGRTAPGPLSTAQIQALRTAPESELRARTVSSLEPATLTGRRGTIRGSLSTNGLFHALRDFHAPLSRPPARARSPGADRRAMGSRRSSCSPRAATSTITTTRRSTELGAVAGGDRADAEQHPRADHRRVRRRRPADDLLERGRRDTTGARRRCAKPRRRCGSRGGFRSTSWSCTSARRRT